jgi:hypothetical protein
VWFLSWPRGNAGRMNEHESHDPGAEPEDEGMPDLQDLSPEGEAANDPQRESVAVDEPVAVERFGTTFNEQVEGESLDERLSEEEPDVGDAEADGPGAQPVGQLTDDPLPWRSANQDSFSTGSTAHGLSGEEAAVYVSEDDDSDLGLGLDAIEEAAAGPDPRPAPPGRPPAVDQDFDEEDEDDVVDEEEEWEQQ